MSVIYPPPNDPPLYTFHNSHCSGAVCADNGRFDRCESLWLHALELRQLNKLSVQRDLLRFAQVFSQMIHVGAATLRLQNVLTVLRSCICELRINQHKFVEPGPKDDLKVVTEEYEANIITALYLCTIISKLLQQGGVAAAAAVAGAAASPHISPGSSPNSGKLPKSERMASYKLVYELAAMRLTMRNGHTLLHLAVDGATPVDDFHISDVCRFPCADTIRLLLMCGARVNEFDCDRNSPLHVLTSTVRVDMCTFCMRIGLLIGLDRSHSCNAPASRPPNRSRWPRRLPTSSFRPAFIWMRLTTMA